MRFHLKDTILIALLPFFAYVAAYFYEVGYLSTFGIPYQLAQVRIESLMVFSVAIIFSYFTVMGLANAIVPIYTSNNTYPLIKKIIKATWSSTLLLIISYVTFPQLLVKMILLVFYVYFILGLLTEFVLPLLPSPKNSNHKQQSKKLNNDSAIYLLKNQTIFNISMLVFLLLGTYIIAQGSGMKNGLAENQFLMFKKSTTTYALVRSYGDEDIAIKLENKKLTTEVLLLNKTDELDLKEVYIVRE